MTEKLWDLSKKYEEGMKILRPDSKAQVTVEYDENHNIVGIDTVVVSTSHTDSATNDIKTFVIERVITPVLKQYNFDISEVKKIYVNPTGRFVVYGPNGDSGLTGRKLVVDQYGGHSAVGGGTMQGKDPSKVDNSAALMARYIAKNIVDAELAKRCQVQISYAIGVAEPVAISVDCFGTNPLYNETIIEKAVKEVFDCRPKAIIDEFSLRKPSSFSYRDCSAFGWFGFEHLPWEITDAKDKLKQVLSTLM